MFFLKADKDVDVSGKRMCPSPALKNASLSDFRLELEPLVQPTDKKLFPGLINMINLHIAGFVSHVGGKCLTCTVCPFRHKSVFFNHMVGVPSGFKQNQGASARPPRQGWKRKDKARKKP